MKKLKNIEQWDTVATAKVSHHRETICSLIFSLVFFLMG